MTIPSKVNLTGTTVLPQVSQPDKAATRQVTDGQALADSGNNPPAALTYDQMVDARKKELNTAVKSVSGYVQNITRELNFSIDETLGKTVVTVVDQSTGEVIRQIPSEDMLKLAHNLAEIRDRSAKGLLFRGDA
ncbi:MAG TPA: flagellar protein FlaG [Candidatus Acidoferrum sp.]|nr:flagellar protein FlaG [Candidatus Acidoferrum sp.]